MHTRNCVWNRSSDPHKILLSCYLQGFVTEKMGAGEFPYSFSQNLSSIINTLNQAIPWPCLIWMLTGLSEEVICSLFTCSSRSGNEKSRWVYPGHWPLCLFTGIAISAAFHGSYKTICVESMYKFDDCDGCWVIFSISKCFGQFYKSVSRILFFFFPYQCWALVVRLFFSG